jgi:hypothetical protein
MSRHVQTGVSDLRISAANFAADMSQTDPFVDGNKHAASIAMGLFRALSGLCFVATGVDTARIVLAPAAGDRSETELAEWLRLHIQRRSDVSGLCRKPGNPAARLQSMRTAQRLLITYRVYNHRLTSVSTLPVKSPRRPSSSKLPVRITYT